MLAIAISVRSLAPEDSVKPLSPDAGTALPASAPFTSPITPSAPPAPPASGKTGGLPAQLIIPAISLNAPIVGVGVNDKGEMDVPNGATNQVGWYKEGTLPGALGSAVLDAHVFAAFKNLNKVKVGDSISVMTEGGRQIRWVISRVAVYSLADVPNEEMFTEADQPRLNLITCAGTFLPGQGTYSHRLVVYATLSGE